LGSSASFSEGPSLGAYLEEAILLETCVWRVVFRAVVFLLRLGRAGRIKEDPCSVEAISDSLIGELLAKEPVSSIRMVLVLRVSQVWVPWRCFVKQFKRIFLWVLQWVLWLRIWVEKESQRVSIT